MIVEIKDAEKLVRSQREVIGNFFGTEVPTPPDRLFEVSEKIRELNLWTPEPFYLPLRKLSQGTSFPGMKKGLDPWLYRQMKDGYVDKDADQLPGQWVIWDTTPRPGYDNGKQMYPDTKQFKEMLAYLRERGDDSIEIPDAYKNVPQASRFAISADEIDGSKAYVAKEVANMLRLRSGEVASTPPYAVFNYIGNLAHPELGLVNTLEWFRNSFGRVGRLYGGRSRFGGLSYVNFWLAGGRDGSIGFRLLVVFPSNS